jgi:hypothetical protein
MHRSRSTKQEFKSQNHAKPAKGAVAAIFRAFWLLFIQETAPKVITCLPPLTSCFAGSNVKVLCDSLAWFERFQSCFDSGAVAASYFLARRMH